MVEGRMKERTRLSRCSSSKQKTSSFTAKKRRNHSIVKFPTCFAGSKPTTMGFSGPRTCTESRYCRHLRGFKRTDLKADAAILNDRGTQGQTMREHNSATYLSEARSLADNRSRSTRRQTDEFYFITRLQHSIRKPCRRQDSCSGDMPFSIGESN